MSVYLYEFKKVDFFDDYFVDDVLFGLDFALAIVRKRIKEDQNSEEYKVGDETMLFSWGYNQHGQCGSGYYAKSLTPRKVKGLDEYNIDTISVWKHFSLIFVQKIFLLLKICLFAPTAITILDRYTKVVSSDSHLPKIHIFRGSNISISIIS